MRRDLELVLTVMDGEGAQIEEIVTVPSVWVVCDRCDGGGSIVNPAIDSHGISREEFDEDPEFEEAYFRGDYDVQCPRCFGRTTVQEVAYMRLTAEQAQFVAQVEEREQENARFEAQCRAEIEAERRFGC